MNFESFESLIREKRYQDAVELCNKAIMTNPESRSEILRKRSHANTLLARYDHAVRDLLEITEVGEGKLSDYYLGAFWSLYTKDFDQSAEWFSIVLKMGQEQNEAWFDSAAYFYLAFIEMERRQFARANQYLDKAIEIEPSDGGLPLPEINWCTNEELRREIRRRASRSSNQDRR